MIKTLLINPPFRLDQPAYWFPIGLGYVATTLRDGGYPVDVLDVDVLRISEKEVIDHVLKGNYDVVGTGGVITSYKYIKRLTKELKRLKPDLKIIVGGHIGTTIPHLIAKHSPVDFITIWEGEETILDLYKNFNNPQEVKGIWYRKGNEMVKNPDRGPTKNINILPAYDLFPTKEYVKTMLNVECKGTKRSMNVLSHRGCPYKCTFCIHSKEPKGMCRSRDVDSVIEEVKFLKERYGVDFIHFFAETFAMDRNWVYEFCDKWMDQKIGLKWSCLTRVNLVDEDLLSKMKSAGCTYVGYGIESASQDILNTMKKGCTVDQQRKALKITKKLELETYPTFIIGTPGETKETVQESVNFCKELGLTPEFFFMTPFPMSILYDYAMEKGLIGDEDKYVEELGECRDLVVNLTGMSDEELIKLKKNAENQILINYSLKHPLGSIGKAIKLGKNYGLSFLLSVLKRRK